MNCIKSFFVEFDEIIELCAGFDDYFKEHPDEKSKYLHVNSPEWQYRKRPKCRDMFIGKKTETFTKLLQAMNIEVDSAYLEAEYYFTPSGEGDVYQYENGEYSIAFDFYIDPTLQIECCAMCVSYPKENEDGILSLVWQLVNSSRCVVPTLYDGDLNYLKTKFDRPKLRSYKSKKSGLNKINIVDFTDKKWFLIIRIIGFVSVLILLIILVVQYINK